MKTIISLGLYKHSGGPTKTIGCFQRALDANLYCFCNNRELERHPIAIDGGVGVASWNVPILRELCVPKPDSLAPLSQNLDDVSILSCHSFYRYHALWVNHLYRRRGIPYWFVPHGILDPWVMDKARFAKQIYLTFGGRRFLEDAKTVIFSTTAEKDKAEYQFELPCSEILPWPVDLVQRQNYQARRSRIREELAIPEDARVLLYFGRLHSMKKPLETIRSVAQARCESLHLVMVGNQQDVSHEDCYAVADECGIASRIHMVGPVYGQEKYDYMMAADAYISLSHRENFNHTAAESLSAGLPLILSPGNDLQADIHSANCSWGLRDESLAVASQTIEEFSQMPLDQLQSMGARGREWVRENLQFSVFAERLQLLAKKYGRLL